MTLRTLRHAALALPVLLAALLCAAFPSAALAEPGKGHGKGQRIDTGYQQARDYRDDPDDSRGNGKGRGQQSDRGNANQKHQDPRGSYNAKSRGDNSGRGNSNPQNRPADPSYYNSRPGPQNQALSAQGAAQRARAQFGGQVLKVQPLGNGYQVRLLKDDGRVVTVPIAD